MNIPVIVEAIEELMKNNYVSNIRADGQFKIGFVSGIKIFVISSPFVNDN
jgi:hypothetical protein